MDKSEEEAPAMARPASSRYESQKRRNWATFTRYLAAHRPPLELRRCSGAHVLEFLRHLDRFGKTRVHTPQCPSYGGAALSSTTHPCHQCQCPLQQAWGSLDALVGRLRAAFADNSRDASGININPFAARAVRLYLRGVRDAQSRARGISYAKKKKKKKRTKKTKIRRGKVDDADAACGKAAASASKTGAEDPAAAASCSGHKRNMTAAATMVQQAAAVPALEPLPPCLAGVPIECYYDVGLGGLGGGLYLPLLFNAFT